MITLSSLKSTCRLLFSSFCLLLAAVASASNITPDAMLDRMSHSFRELNYQGLFSFQRGDTMESFRISHAVIDGKEYERLVYMDGEKREIVRRGHPLDCVHPGHQLIQFYQKGHTPAFRNGMQSELANYYQIMIKEPGRVAGRNVINLELSPKDTHRFTYRLSLDDESGLLLRSELVGMQNKVLERFQFVEVSIGNEMLASEFSAASESNANKSYHASHIEPVVAQSNELVEGWKINWLPAGFTSAIANKTVITEDMATFTDGFSGFSVFIEKDIEVSLMNKETKGHAQRGATTAFSSALMLGGRPHRVTVVGEIPSHTAEKIAQSITLVAPLHASGSER